MIENLTKQDINLFFEKLKGMTNQEFLKFMFQDEIYLSRVYDAGQLSMYNKMKEMILKIQKGWKGYNDTCHEAFEEVLLQMEMILVKSKIQEK